MAFDLVVTNGIIVTASEILSPGVEIGINDGIITCLGNNLPRDPTTRILDAEGAYITPGGVDSHVHFAQANSPTGDTWETGSRSAIAGGTTTVLAFATQSKSESSVLPAVAAYHALATDHSYCDYSFHLILTNPTPPILTTELPLLAAQGITSIKLYTTYAPLQLPDAQLLAVLAAARPLGLTTMIHAENDAIITHITRALTLRAHTAPHFHALARPPLAESEATHRVISLAELLHAPILLVHMSAPHAVHAVRKAQTRCLPVHAETCPQYLFLLADRLNPTPHDPFEGAKCVCSPPLRRHAADLDALWAAIANGTFTTVSSDHAPSTYDHPGGKKLGLDPATGAMRFVDIPNGLPGVETRLALLFSCAGDREGCRLTLERFVQLTSSDPARLYGLQGRKGGIAPGYDADLVVWYPGARGETVIAQERMHHIVDYTPYEGMAVRNWPRYTLLRGKVVWDRDHGGVVGEMGDGKFLVRGRGKVLVGRSMAEEDSKGDKKYWM